MCDSSAGTLLTELNRVNARKDLCPIAIVLGVILLIFLTNLQAWWALLGTAGGISILAVCLRHLDVINGTALLEYSIEGDAGLPFGKLQGSFGELGACRLAWRVDAQGATNDWK